MKFMRFIYMISIILLVLTLISGCNQRNVTKIQQEDGVYIMSSSTAIGADESSGVENTDVQILSYNFTLYNSTNKKVFINTIEPVFEQNFAKKIISKDNIVIVQKELQPNSSMTIEGNKIRFDAKGMTKEQISNLAPYITDIKVKTEEILNFGFAKKIN